MKFTGNYREDRAAVRKILQPDISFDLVTRDVIIGERQASLYFVDGFIKDGVFEKVFQYLLDLTPEKVNLAKDMDGFASRYMPYVEAATEPDVDNAVTAVLSGQTMLLLEGFQEALIIDARTYPSRGVTEPDKDRVLRGSREGYTETMVTNTSMLRRRIRDPKLRIEHQMVGSGTKLDVAVCYLEGQADEKLVRSIQRKLSEIKVHGLSMTQEGIAEALIPYKWINPLPKIKYTERPDYTAACVMEGRVAIIMDNSPTAILLPANFSDFFKEADDYYFPPVTASYLKIIRLLISALTVFMTPLFFYFIRHPNLLPDCLSFIALAEPEKTTMAPLAQFLLLELIIDVLRLASTNTPSMMSNALGIIGGLLLSEFSIQGGWFAPEIILYMAFVSIASYAQPSFEMGYAFKFFRIIVLLLTAWVGLWGYFGGIVFFFLTVLCTKTVTGKGYFYPVIPFNARDFRKLFIRRKLKNQK